MGAASLTVSSSWTKLKAPCLGSMWFSGDGLYKWWPRRFPIVLRASWADSAASLGVRVPLRADSRRFIRELTVSSTCAWIRARLVSVSLACLGSFDLIAGSILGRLLGKLSGGGCFLFMPSRFSLGSVLEKAS